MRKFLLIVITVTAMFDASMAFLLATRSAKQQQPNQETNSPRANIPALPVTDSLYIGTNETLRTGEGVKSVLINAEGSRVYALNLEGMSVYEFDRQQRKIARKLKFVPTPAKGYDYDKKIWYSSHEEKPVEGCFSHNGRYLWISLHNAGGIVVWDLQQAQTQAREGYKQATLVSADGSTQTVWLPFIKTGKTPKVIVYAPEANYLFVSNWHDNTVSRVHIAGHNPDKWRKDLDLKATIPRGLAVDNRQRLLVANMAAQYIDVYAYQNFGPVAEIPTGYSNRHLLVAGNTLYASLSSLNQIVLSDLDSLKPFLRANTAEDPRTIALSPDGSVLAVTCYLGNSVQFFDAKQLRLLAQQPIKGGAVGVCMYQNVNKIEAWICCHQTGNIEILTLTQFLKK